ncbi:MAG: MFS transporter [Myxococcales bacterium]|nr:MFS transporter [Myxococcales bacterium]MCB9628011.1 MFS transporter [Sandaracinaceae bacterium]
MMPPNAAPTPRPRLPRAIWALGVVSLLMDVSSEMIHGLMPGFLVTTLGASALSVGLIEGVGEATAAVTKLFSGVLSDRSGRRKPLTVLGYGLAVLSKPLFALAPAVGWVLGARVTDRVGKGIRGAPRDALVGDLAPPGMKGAAYGLRQSLDNVGAFVGPLLAMLLMARLADDYRAIFWVSVVPGALAVLVLVLAVREPPRSHTAPAPFPLDRTLLVRLGRRFWLVVVLGSLMTLARFSEAFVILRSQERGLALALAPVVLVVIHVVSSLSSYPVGVLSDRLGRRGLLALGFGMLAAADAVLACALDSATALLGAALWGLHLGMTQGLLAALVAETAPADTRATAFGVFNLTTGLTLLLASLLAGGLWEWAGPVATFWCSAALAAVGALAFYALTRDEGEPAAA